MQVVNLLLCRSVGRGRSVSRRPKDKERERRLLPARSVGHATVGRTDRRSQPVPIYFSAAARIVYSYGVS